MCVCQNQTEVPLHMSVRVCILVHRWLFLCSRLVQGRVLGVCMCVVTRFLVRAPAGMRARVIACVATCLCACVFARVLSCMCAFVRACATCARVRAYVIVSAHVL